MGQYGFSFLYVVRCMIEGRLVRLIRLMVYLFTYVRDICILFPFRLTILVADAGSFLLFLVDWSKMEFNFISYFTFLALLPSVLFTQPTIALVALACFFSCAVQSWLYILLGVGGFPFPVNILVV